MDDFKNLFRAQRESWIVEIINIAQLFLRFVEEENNDNLMAEIRAEELLAISHSFQKDKSPKPDGWPIKIYLGLYELIGDYLLKVVEESQKEGFTHAPFNSTFISLIPKSHHPRRFEDIKPISLCNCLYNIISKIIARRLKGILSRQFLRSGSDFWKVDRFMKLSGWLRKVYIALNQRR